MRENTAGLKPPRALWVPFELGRPMGAPNDPAFQMKVLKMGLEMLMSDAGSPLLVDFPEDAPASRDGGTDSSTFVCPVSFPSPPDDSSQFQKTLLSEIGSLSPWYEMALSERGRTTVGLNKLSIDETAKFLIAVLEGSLDNPLPDKSFGIVIKRATEDLKAFYLEAATAQPTGGSSQDIYAWFWTETTAGKLFIELHDICQASDDEDMQYLATKSFVPRAFQNSSKSDC